MIISNQQVRKILGLPSGQLKVQLRSAASGVTALDPSVPFGAPLTEVSLARERVSQTDDIRLVKVGELKRQIQAGGYQVSSDEIATKMLSRSLVDLVVSRYL